MLNRTYCKKDSAPSYDPQVGEAAKANAAIAERSMQFSEDYYNKYVAPLLEEMTAASKSTRANQDELFSQNMQDLQMQRDRYQKYGVPAEDRYFNAVDQYSSKEEEERQATAAIGDVRTAAAGQKAQMDRTLASRGINLTSPAAIMAQSDMAVANAAAEAGAANRARTAAKALGLQLTSDAANFGRGGQSSVLAFGQAASGNTNAALGATTTGLGAAGSGAGVVQNGYSLGLKGYGQNLSAYTSLQSSATQQNAQADAGFGNFLGTVIGAGITKYSDRRLKRNIVRVGKLRNDINVYAYNYLWDAADAPKHIGVMADEVEHVIPAAVITDEHGYKSVDYSLLG